MEDDTPSTEYCRAVLAFTFNEVMCKFMVDREYINILLTPANNLLELILTQVNSAVNRWYVGNQGSSKSKRNHYSAAHNLLYYTMALYAICLGLVIANAYFYDDYLIFSAIGFVLSILAMLFQFYLIFKNAQLPWGYSKNKEELKGLTSVVRIILGKYYQPLKKHGFELCYDPKSIRIFVLPVDIHEEQEIPDFDDS